MTIADAMESFFIDTKDKRFSTLDERVKTQAIRDALIKLQDDTSYFRNRLQIQSTEINQAYIDFYGTQIRIKDDDSYEFEFDVQVSSIFGVYLEMYDEEFDLPYRFIGNKVTIDCETLSEYDSIIFDIGFYPLCTTSVVSSGCEDNAKEYKVLDSIDLRTNIVFLLEKLYLSKLFEYINDIERASYYMNMYYDSLRKTDYSTNENYRSDYI